MWLIMNDTQLALNTCQLSAYGELGVSAVTYPHEGLLDCEHVVQPLPV